jgi:radical SAM superfamily enzyme YgiQ (UPF0313 family)
VIQRISFVEPIQDRVHLFSRYRIPRLGGLLLATLMKERGYEARVLFLSEKEILERRLGREGGERSGTDLAALSTITPTVPQAYRLAGHFRAHGIPVVIGGPHVTFLPEEALDHADYVIRGEGEAALPLLVEALNGRGRLEDVPGLAWKDERGVHRNPLPQLLEDLDSLPFPDFALLDTGGRKMGGPFGREILPLQTSRGCPFDCTFCSVTCMFGRRYRYRSTKNVIAELARYDRRKHFPFFYDDNFASNPRRTKELLRRMIERDFRFNWMTQVRSDVARDGELLDLMAAAGCTYLFVGFESADPAALEEMRKSQSLPEIERAIAEIRRRGIYVHGMFVFGFDADTPGTIRRTVDFAIDRKIDTVQFLALTPIPGTQLFETLEREGRILDREWGTFDGLHVKHRPTGFTPGELQAALIAAHRSFYTLGRVLQRLIAGRIRAVYLSLFARFEIRRWLRRERPYLDTLNRRV